ncbi:MAG: sigma 54-interacting transcriptional regulator [Syntrophomonadaceae bacterium]
MNISEAMTITHLVITPNLTAAQVAQIFIDNDLDLAKVTDDSGMTVGYISQAHLLHAFTKGIAPNTSIKDIMTTNPDKIEPDHIHQESSSNAAPDNSGNPQPGRTMPSYQSLQKHYNELRACFDAMYNPVVCVDNNEDITYYNAAARSFFGFEASEVLGQNVTKLCGITKLEEVIKTGQTQSAQKMWRSGKTYLSNRTPIYDEDKIIGAVVVLQEISDLENIIKELTFSKQLNRELDALFESSYDGLYLTDGEGNTLRVNQGFERITGIPAAKCLGKNMADLVREGFYSRSATLLALEKRERVTITLKTGAGNIVLVTSNPIFDKDGKIILVATNVRDITELNELRRKLEHSKDTSQIYQGELLDLKLKNSKQMVVHSQKMRDLVDMVVRLAAVDSTVLIQGESGVGKELIAELLHTNSNRKNGPFIKINCGAIPENLLESELFGYDPGAFSGASKNGKAGLFELASGGVLFLDEIGDMPLSLQVKLLRAIQDMEITRVGGVKPIKVDLRIFAGTNRDLHEMSLRGEFRQDLYYRLNVVPIVVPPLRERPEDIPILSAYFLDFFNRKYHMNKRLASNVMVSFIEYNWPGNVRELENLIERLVVTTVDDEITTAHLPLWVKKAIMPEPDSSCPIVTMRHAVENAERELLKNAFARYKSTYEVAEVLQVNQSTVVRKAAKYGITR